MMHSVGPQYSSSGNDGMDMEDNNVIQHLTGYNGHPDGIDEAYIEEIERYMAHTHLQDRNIPFRDTSIPDNKDVIRPKRAMPELCSSAQRDIHQALAYSGGGRNDADGLTQGNLYNNSLGGRDLGMSTEQDDGPPTEYHSMISVPSESISSDCMVFSGAGQENACVCDTIHVPCLQANNDALIIGGLSQQGQLEWAGLPSSAGPLQLVLPTETRPYEALHRLIRQYGQNIYEGLPRLLAAAEMQRDIRQWQVWGVIRPSHRSDVAEMIRSLRALHNTARAAVQGVLDAAIFQRSPLTPFPHRRRHSEETVREMIHREVLELLDKQLQTAREKAAEAGRLAGGVMVEAGKYVVERMGAAAAVAAENTPWAIQMQKRIDGRLQNHRVMMQEGVDEDGNGVVMVDQLGERDEPIFLDDTQDWEML